MHCWMSMCHTLSNHIDKIIKDNIVKPPAPAVHNTETEAAIITALAISANSAQTTPRSLLSLSLQFSLISLFMALFFISSLSFASFSSHLSLAWWRTEFPVRKFASVNFHWLYKLVEYIQSVTEWHVRLRSAREKGYWSYTKYDHQIWLSA